MIHTDFDEWRMVAQSSQPAWESRARIIAKLVRSTDSIIDIGAGDRKLARFIPPSCKYTPVDCVDSLPGTFVVDFNTEFRLPDVEFDVAVCAGFLEYLNDVSAFFRDMAKYAPGKQIIFTYLISDEKKQRKTKLVHNDFPSYNALFNAIEGSLSHISVFAFDRETLFVSATLSTDSTERWVSTGTIADIVESQNRPKRRGIRGWLARLARSSAQQSSAPAH